MKEKPWQYQVHGTPVPTTRTHGTNYPKSTPEYGQFAGVLGSFRNWGLCIAIWFSLWMLCHFSSSALHK